MLIKSDRVTDADLQAWHQAERTDTAWALTDTHHKRVHNALEHVQTWARTRPLVVGCSWGKDSIVASHLAATTGPTIVWHAAATKPGRPPNPDSPLVEQAARSHPDLQNVTWETYHPPSDIDDALGWVSRHHHPRSISGVRADESADRALSARVHGTATDTTCRPILRWEARDVFAYLHTHELPVHPAYACTIGGALERASLRVHSLGGPDGNGVGRAEWERRYYGQHQSQ